MPRPRRRVYALLRLVLRVLLISIFSPPAPGCCVLCMFGLRVWVLWRAPPCQCVATAASFNLCFNVFVGLVRFHVMVCVCVCVW